jgi:hypothetical protein
MPHIIQIAALAVEDGATARISYKSDWQNLNLSPKNGLITA